MGRNVIPLLSLFNSIHHNRNGKEFVFFCCCCCCVQFQMTHKMVVNLVTCTHVRPTTTTANNRQVSYHLLTPIFEPQSSHLYGWNKWNVTNNGLVNEFELFSVHCTCTSYIYSKPYKTNKTSGGLIYTLITHVYTWITIAESHLLRDSYNRIRTTGFGGGVSCRGCDDGPIISYGHNECYWQPNRAKKK